jgi:hypothetical protein
MSRGQTTRFTKSNPFAVGRSISDTVTVTNSFSESNCFTV